MQKQIADILVTALLSGGVFMLVVLLKQDFIFMFLATLPLFSVGLAKNPQIVIKAGIVATVLITLLTSSIAISLLYILVFAAPSYYISNMTLRHYDIKLSSTFPTLRLWYPIGLIITNLAIYSSILLAAITAIFATQDTNLPQELIIIIQTMIESLSKDYEINVNIPASDIAFMISGFMAWIWGFLLISCAWIANSSLARINLAKRPNIIITPFPIPHWLLSLMAIWALASLIGGESMRFLGKASLIILLLPYFFQGMAMLHNHVKNWPNRLFFLITTYILMVVFIWPALLMIGAGLWQHIKTLNKHLSSGGTSSKN